MPNLTKQDKEEILRRWKNPREGRIDTITMIAKDYGKSKQRIWQILRRMDPHIPSRAYTRSTLTPAELFVSGKLQTLGLTPIINTNGATHQILANGLTFEVRHVSSPALVKNNYYYRFTNLPPLEGVDFLIAICGSLELSTVYVIPANQLKTHLVIPFSPQSNTRRQLHREAWTQITERLY